MWSLSSIQRMYRSMLLVIGTGHVAATCHYLMHCAQARGVSTALYILGNSRYCIDDGAGRQEQELPVGLEWGACEQVFGPPSHPTRLVVGSLVGGDVTEKGRCLRWEATGAYTPGTLYLRNGPNHCSAISLPLALYGIVHSYYWYNGRWISAPS